MDKKYETLLRIKKNQVRMLKRRGFDTSEEDDLENITVKEFKEKYSKISEEKNIMFLRSLNQLYEKYDTDGKLVDSQYVFYMNNEPGKKQLCKPQIDIMTQVIENMPRVKRVILISEQSINNQSEKRIHQIRTKIFQHFRYNDLKIDIFDNVTVPKQRILADKERLEIFKNSDDIENFPDVYVDDSIVKYLWGLPGDILESYRQILVKSVIVKYTEFYRKVIKS